MADKNGFFEDHKGNPSSMRLMSFIALIASIGFGLLTILRSGGQNGVFVTAAFLVAAFAPKAVQKFAENKLPEQ